MKKNNFTPNEITARGTIRKYIIGADAEAKKQALKDIRKEYPRFIPKFNKETRLYEKYQISLECLTYSSQEVAEMLGKQTIIYLIKNK